jgi:hypothetical protein
MLVPLTDSVGPVQAASIGDNMADAYTLSPGLE